MCIRDRLCSFHLANGQEVKLSGKVVDEYENPVALVSVLVVETKKLVATNQDGVFNITLPKEGDYTIVCSHAAFVKNSKKISTKQLENPLLFVMKTPSIQEVVIEDKRTRKSTLSKIEAKTVNYIPSPSSDFNAILASQAGVSMNNELSSAYNVRGGNFDENLVYVNDIEVYRPFLVRAGQQEGLSFVNPNMVSSVLFSAGCLLYTSPSPRDGLLSRMPSSA